MFEMGFFGDIGVKEMIEQEIEQIKTTQIALFNLVCALFYKMTRQIPTVNVWTNNGVIPTVPCLDDVICSAEPLQFSSVHQKETNKVSVH